MKKIVSIIGEGVTDKKNYEIAVKIGELLAKNGIIICCGGLGGVMEGVCKGANRFNGLTIGILPGNNVLSANEFIDIAIPTGLGFARNYFVVLIGAVIIAVGGRFGTLSEIGYALDMGKDVIAINSWNFEKKGINLSKYHKVEDVSSAFNLVMELLNKTG